MISAGRPGIKNSDISVDTPTQDIDDDYETDIEPPPRPSANRPMSDFTKTETKAPKTSHTVYEIFENGTNKKHYFKETSPQMGYLEAAAVGAYRMLTPHHMMPAYAIYDEKKCVGVASEGIPNFKSLAVDPLEEIDLNYDYLGKTPEEQFKKIQVLEKIDAEFRKIKKDVDEKEAALDIELKKNENERLAIETEFKQKRAHLEKEINAFKNRESFAVNQNGEPLISATIEARKIKKSLRKINSEESNLLNKNKTKNEILKFKQINLGSKIKRFDEITYHKYKIKPDEFDRYRMIKGLSNALTPRYFYVEDDFHRNNFNKFGLNYDCDMSFWNLFNDFKDKGIADRVFRPPGPHHLIVTIEDILNFPNTEAFLPYYWPTSQTKASSISSTTGFFKTLQAQLGLPNNNYEIKDNELFKKLSTHPVFKYHKYVNLTKCILMTKNICRQNAEKHIPPDIMHTFNGKKDYLINHFVRMHESRVQAFKQALIQIPEFQEFFKENHERIAEEFLEDLKDQGIKYTADEINDACVEMKTALATDINSPETEIKKVSNTILLAFENQKKSWADKVKDSSANYTQSMKTVQQKLAPYAPPSEGYLGSILNWSGMWGKTTTVSSPEDKTSAEKILQESLALPNFIEQNKNAMGSNIYLAAMRKMYDNISSEVETLKKKAASSETKEEPKGIYNDLISLKLLLEKHLPNDMLPGVNDEEYQAPEKPHSEILAPASLRMASA